jgi:NAD(P)-dependent dehydrogenase (short-subunit alcohol dehydrogenase family)
MTSSAPIALITGGSRGLGRAMALALAERGYDLVITYHSNAQAAQETLTQIAERQQKGMALQLDCAASDSFPAFTETLAQTLSQQWGRTQFDALINNAGHGINMPFAETSEAAFDSLVNTHLKGPFFLSQTLLPLIVQGGQIVNISSGLSRFTQPGFAAYGTVKGAIDTLTRYMAAELGSRGIRVNVIAPGPIETDFGGGLVRDNTDVNHHLSSITPLGRVGLPQDIGAAVAGLISASGPWITGQRIEVSGGILL